jgi:5-methylcytosine-specific restriction endonuclease McrA
MRPCIDCGTPTRGTRCPRCELGKRHARAIINRTYTRYWRRLRVERLLLDRGVCQRCGGRADTVHLSPALQGRHDLATLEDCVSLCRRCHGAIDAPRSRRGGGQ